MSGQILNSVYQYYQSEGIPPYPSRFIPIDFYIVNWIDTTDIYRIRTEKHYNAPEFTPSTGIEYYVVSTGLGGNYLRRRYWNGQLFKQTDAPIENKPPSFDEWLEKTANDNREYIRNSENKESALIGEAIDETFGLVKTVTVLGEVRASDLYLGMPLEITQKFDVDLMRLIERTETIRLEGNNNVLHRRYRLLKWDYVDSKDLPAGIYDPDRLVGLVEEPHK
jgi:hypothetical protein